MAIPETQLETWSNPGAVVSSQATHTSVRAALHADTSRIKNMNFEIYLQGSYRSDTNVRSDSDVDIVVQLNSTFGHNALALPSDQYRAFLTSYPTIATYNWPDFRADVLRSLKAYYGQGGVTEGSRCLRVSAGVGRLTADVIPALVYYGYGFFYGQNAQSHVEGIQFQDRNGRTIVNYPKVHYENGVSKNSEQQTNGWFKPTVRMIKNARTCASERGLLNCDDAPSYFVDCLVWNVPDSAFGGSYRDTYFRAVKWMLGANLGTLYCRNGIVSLFGPSPEQWSQASASRLIGALASLWDRW
jgi:hypothetical protein